MFKKIILICFIFFANSTTAKNLVTGPYSLKDVANTTIEFANNKDESISLLEIKKNSQSLIDIYEVGDGTPKIETVFFYKNRDQRNFIVLVSWDEENINSIHYKTYGYSYNLQGTVRTNDDITNDKNLEGYDGYSSSGLTFDYKNAQTIKEYLINKDKTQNH